MPAEPLGVVTMFEWWQPQQVDHGWMARWKVGPLSVSVANLPGEWQVAAQQSLDDDRAAETSEPEAASVSVEPFTEIVSEATERYAAKSETKTLQLLPALADRSLVVKPRVPLFIPQGEQIRIFVGSPVWVQLVAGDSKRLLREWPVKRLSDTWFGSSTRDGELSYALKTQARLALDGIPIQPYRAVTPVLLRNEAAETLAVERLNLPVPLLSLFSGQEGWLWTQALTLRQTENSEFAVADIGERAPREAGQASRVVGPRRRSEKNLVVRAFSSLWKSDEGGD